MDELKKCPFCNGDPRRVTQGELKIVACKCCNAMTAVYKKQEFADKAWNLRHEM